ncbi:SRPBCC domain-containing protein [Rhodococcus sp. NPDC060086]|uniref:SRPBCC domain-containing protein n=1 Tax=Rhodococcus sp. NPDC060086 TaxID=3347055 RepID=UPI003664B911
MSIPTTFPGVVRPERDCPDGSNLVTLQYQRAVVRSLGEVWTALTDPESLLHWYGSYTGDPTTGWIRLTMTDQHDSATTDVRVVRCTPPTGFVVDIDGWLLEVSLHAVGQVTTVEFSHRHVPRSQAGEIGPGWQYYLDRLEATLLGSRLPQWDEYPDLVDEYR